MQASKWFNASVSAIGRQLQLLRALAEADGKMRAAGQAPEFLLIALGPSYGLKPSVEDEDELRPSHGDVLDLEDKGYLRQLPRGRTVAARFALTEAGRAAAQSNPDVNAVNVPGRPADPDDVLAWLSDLPNTDRHGLLTRGTELLAAGATQFGVSTEALADALLALGDDGMIAFDDPSADVDQLSSSQRLGNAGTFRLTARGRDRLRREAPAQTNITQTITAVNAQVAAGDITNIVSFEQLLDRAEAEIDALEHVGDDDRADAKSLIDKLRGSSATIATGATASAGGAVLGAVLRNLLNLG